MENQAAPSPSKKLIPILSAVLVAIAVIAVIFVVKGYKERLDQQNTQDKTTLSISTPADLTATNQASIKVAGTSPKGSVITINSSKKQQIIESSTGDFAIDLELSEGKNSLSISSFDPKTGKSQTLTRQVLYLNEDFSNL